MERQVAKEPEEILSMLGNIFGDRSRTLVQFSESQTGTSMREYLDSLGSGNLRSLVGKASTEAISEIASALGGKFPIFLATWRGSFSRDVPALEVDGYFQQEVDSMGEFTYDISYADASTLEEIQLHVYRKLKQEDQTVAMSAEEPVRQLNWPLIKGERPCMLILAREPFPDNLMAG
jgi:hypothetical protein